MGRRWGDNLHIASPGDEQPPTTAATAAAAITSVPVGRHDHGLTRSSLATFDTLRDRLNTRIVLIYQSAPRAMTRLDWDITNSGIRRSV